MELILLKYKFYKEFLSSFSSKNCSKRSLLKNKKNKLMKTLKEKIRDTIKFYKILRYGAGSWWITLPPTITIKDKDMGRERVVIADEESYDKKGISFKLAKLHIAKYLGKHYVFRDDGIYEIIDTKDPSNSFERKAF